MIALKNTTNNQIFYIIHRRMDGEQGWDLMPLNVEYTENGQYSVVPPSGFDGFSSVNVTVDVDQNPCKLTTSTVNIADGGEHIITPPEGYDGFSEVVVNVESDCGTCYDEGVADQKAKLTSTTFTENGNYIREDGWNAVQVNVDTVTPYNNGVADQKAKLTSLNVTQNGTYRREDGYNEVVVNVPTSDNCLDCYEEGVADQKARLTSATFVTNGHYTLADGWNDVTVNVDTVTPYNNGFADGQADQKSKLIAGTFTQNGTYNREDGYNRVVVNVDTQTPYNNGYDDGYGDGETDQKAKLDTLYVTHNGHYTREDGWNDVTVNVDCGAYSDVLELDKNQIDVMSSADEFPYEGLTYQVTLYSSCPWEITGTPWWVSVDQIAGSAGMFIININITDFMDNESGYITFENECGLTDEIVINEIDYKLQPLTFKATHSGCLYWKQYGIAYSRPLDILNSEGRVVKTIHSIRENNGCLVQCFSAGDIIRFRSIPTDQQDPQDTYSYFVFADGLRGELYGNLNNFLSPQHSLASYGCYHLFQNCIGLESVEHLYIPEVASYYCSGMFSGCSSLKTVMPELPDETLSQGCYAGMFYDCINLVNPPKLPSVKLATECYLNMFAGCTKLKVAPDLPATSTRPYCYAGMFARCDSLTRAPYLPATEPAQNSYNNMFSSCDNLEYINARFINNPNDFASGWVYGVSQSGTFVKNVDATWNVTGNSGIPTGWTVETM